MRTVVCIHRCIICMYTNTSDRGYAKEHKLHICDRCNMIQYCGRTHQRMDWPEHKKFCNAVAEIKKDLRITHPLMMIEGRTPKTKSEMSDAILRFKFLVRSKLNAPLSIVETELTSFPAHCAVCFKYKGVKPCTHCHGVAYCSKAHRDQHAATHKVICAALNLLYSPHNMFVKPRDVYLKFHSLTFPAPIENMGETEMWDVFKQLGTLQMPDNPTASRDEFLKFSLVADFSYIFNICYGLHSAQQYLALKAEDMNQTNYTVYVVGAKEEGLLWFYILQQRFFFTQFPNAKMLRLYFIGPQVADTKKILNKFKVQGRDCEVIIHGFKMLFEDFVEKHADKHKPNLIMCFNCGFAEDSQIIDDCTAYIQRAEKIAEAEKKKEDEGNVGDGKSKQVETDSDEQVTDSAKAGTECDQKNLKGRREENKNNEDGKENEPGNNLNVQETSERKENEADSDKGAKKEGEIKKNEAADDGEAKNNDEDGYAQNNDEAKTDEAAKDKPDEKNETSHADRAQNSDEDNACGGVGEDDEFSSDSANNSPVKMPTKSLWFYGLVALFRYDRCPIVFTSYTRKEAEYDFSVLGYVKQAALPSDYEIMRFLYKTPNPYRDLRPIRMWTDQFDSEEIFYRNGHITGIFVHNSKSHSD